MGRFGLAGAVVILLLIVGALAPLSAYAAPAFKADLYPVTIHGSSVFGNEVINTEGGKVECAVSYHAELKEASSTLALAPTYTNCEAFGFLSAATVSPEGCTYLLHISEQSAEDKYKTSFDIACPAGKSIKIVASTCKAEIASQGGLGFITLINDTEATPKRDITFDPEVSGLAYTVTQDGFLCPFSGTGSKTGGAYTASSPTTLTGQSPSSPETKVGVEVGY
jgi:hypothetical protein